MLERLNDEEIMREYAIKNIIRYNVRTKIKEETVSDHTCFVSIFVLKILSQLKIKDEKLFRETITLAILHDLPESKTSDIPWDIKKENPSLKLMMSELEDEYYRLYWKDYKDTLDNKSELSMAILKLADVYSVYQYCLNEINLGNNTKEFKEIFENSKERIDNEIEKINRLIKEEGEE